VNTVAALTGGRVCVNVVAGHTPDELHYYGDFLTHDERYARTDEFLAICNAFWRGEGPVDFDGAHFRVEQGRLNVPFLAPDRARPELFIGGNSTAAEDLAIRHGDCLWRMPEPIETVRSSAARVLRAGKEVGILTSLIARPTREAAVRAAQALVAETGTEAHGNHQQIERKLDSTGFRAMYAMARNDAEWPAPYLWTGAVPYFGAPSIALVGSFDEIADTLLAYKAAGISQFLFLGWPDLEEMTLFRDEVLPRVRALEAGPVEATA
jgi:alkanesulfonate monooxygenase